jgi:acyl carrier protein
LETDNGIRTGGVSSYGLTGTNVHMVVVHKEVKTRAKDQDPHYFLQIGETTRERLEMLKQQLIRILENDPSADLKTFSQKINRLYDANKYNEGIIFSDRDVLLHELRQPAGKRVEEAAFLLLDLDVLSYDPALIKNILGENNIIKKCWQDVIGKAYSPEHIANGAVLNVLFQYVLYKYLLSLLGNKLQVVTRQGEGVLQALLNNKLQPSAIINDPGLISISQHQFNWQHFENYLHKNFAQQKVVLIDFSGDNEMRLPDAGNVIKINGAFHAKARYQLYKELLTVNKEPLRSPNVPVPLPFIQLPVYQLSRFWPKNTPVINSTSTAIEVVERSEEQPKIMLSMEEIMTRVKPIWQQVLELEQDISPTDDFFELGGDSLSGLDMLSQLNKKFKARFISYEEMFSFSTLEKLCATLQERLTPNTDIAEKSADRSLANH